MNIFRSARLTGGVLAGALLLAAPPPASAQAAAPNHPRRLSAKSLQQIAALEAEADARTGAQKKVSSHLLFTARMARGEAAAPGFPTQRTNVEVAGDGSTLVDIEADVTPALLHALAAAGGQVVSRSVRFGEVRARVPLGAVESLAALPEVRFIKPAVKAQLQNPAPVRARVNLLRRAGPMKRPARLRAHLSGRAAVGSVEDEADKAHQADKARAAFHVDGTGIKVGVLSDSIDNGNNVYAAAVASGDVSPVTVIAGQDGGSQSGEGLAMLEAVHHLAPGAHLYFATGDAGEGQFADNIIALQQAGCKVIVDDEFSPAESPFQDGVVAQAVNTVTASGVMYFSCAANYGNQADGTSSTWENDFSDSGDTSLGDGNIHQFDSNGDEQNTVSAKGTGGTALVSLYWTDPLGKSTTDYDLFILDASGNVMASSTDRQTGAQDPYESATAANGENVVIVKHSGPTRYLHLDLASQNSTLQFATADRVSGHNATANAFCVAATPATTGTPNGPDGPYPNPFDASALVETFSDDGPRRVFFNPDGSPITADLTNTGGRVLNKPDFTAADGTSNTLTQAGVGDGKEPESPFFGTSCAAPHAAAIAALVLSYNGSLTRAQLASILAGSATDIMAAGYDTNSGAGILNAYKALTMTPAPAAPASGHVTHVLWDNADGTASLWTVGADGTYTHAEFGPYSGWTAKSLADAPDGTTHLLWRNISGKIAVWNLAGGALQAEHDFGPFSGYTAAALSTGADGLSHLLWNKSDGTASLWSLDTGSGGFTYKNYGPFGGWTAKAVATGGDNATDLLWDNANGQLSTWRISGADGSYINHEFGPYPGWTATALSTGPDGRGHVLWDNTNGTASLWNADLNAGTETFNNYGPYGGWSSRAVATGGDGVTHLLWDHAPDGQMSLWAVGAGSAFSFQNYGPFPGWTAVAVSAGP